MSSFASSSVTPAQAYYLLRIVGQIAPDAHKGGFASFVPGFAPVDGEAASATAAKALSTQPGRQAVNAALDYAAGQQRAKAKLHAEEFWALLGLKPRVVQPVQPAQAAPPPKAKAEAKPAQARLAQTAPVQPAQPQTQAAGAGWTPGTVMEAVKLGLLTPAEGRKLLGLDAPAAPITPAPAPVQAAPAQAPVAPVTPAQAAQAPGGWLETAITAYNLLLAAQDGSDVAETAFAAAERLIKGLSPEQAAQLKAAIADEGAEQAEEDGQNGDVDLDATAPAGANPVFTVDYGYADDADIPF